MSPSNRGFGGDALEANERRKDRIATLRDADPVIPWGIDLPGTVHKRLDSDFDLFLILNAVEDGERSRAHRLTDGLAITCRWCGASIDSIDVLAVVVAGEDPRASMWECERCAEVR